MPTFPCAPAKLKDLFHQSRGGRPVAARSRTLPALALPILPILALPALAGAALPAVPLAGQEEPPRREAAPASGGSDDAPARLRFVVEPAAGAVEIDARLGEPAWSEATAVPLPWETAPGDNEPAPVRTECLLTYDESRLYLGCRAHDPRPDEIRAYITDRDETDGHDRVIFSLDPFDDARRAFEFSVSALGVQGDAVFDERSGSSDASWDAIWSSAGRIAEDGYVVEAAIPFRSLRFPAGGDLQTWGFHVRREWPRGDRVETRSMRRDRGDGCTLCQANRITGIRDVAPGANLEVAPTLTTSRRDTRDSLPAGELRAGPLEPEPGLDVRWGPSSDLALNLTLNPDFSQIEADAPQLAVNNRFALLFPEKRPFFLEGADLFRTPVRAVFTRSVVDPIAGAKLTGKIGGSAIGASLTRDRMNRLLLPGSQGSSTVLLERGVTGAVARFRRDVGASGTVGALYTGRLGDGYGNHVAGVDAFVRPLRPLGIAAQVLRSATRYPESVAGPYDQPGGWFAGTAARIDVRYRTRDWHVTALGRALEPEFRADAGFVPRVDVREIQAWGGRDVWGGEGDPFTRIGLVAGGWILESWVGRPTSRGVWATAEVDGPLQSNLWVNPNWIRERFDGETHDLVQWWSGGSIRPSGALSLRVWGMIGNGIDFANSRAASQWRLSEELALRIGRRLEVELSGSAQRMSLEGEEIFTAVVSELRTVYNFDPRAFVRATLQYRDTHRNLATFRDPVRPDESALSTQLLFSYKVNPLTVLFLGYGDDRSGFTRPDLERVSLTRTGRTFFLKLGYAWRP